MTIKASSAGLGYTNMVNGPFTLDYKT